MTAEPELAAGLAELSRQRGGIDWGARREAVVGRLRPVRTLPPDLVDPLMSPAYWCVPLLVGDYVGADTAAINRDVEQYAAGCLVRHLYFERTDWFADPENELATVIGAAYATAGLPAATFADRFSGKCRSWTTVLAHGTQETRGRGRAADVTPAMAAIVAVFSCVQVLDDWHDRDDDATRGHWNMWHDEPPSSVLQALNLLARDASAQVNGLRPHPLRAALTAQLRDTTAELADLVTVSVPDTSRRHRDPREVGAAHLIGNLGCEVAGLWSDFAAPMISPGSTECISAFMATQLAPTPAAEAVARSVASTLLAHARPSGGWGYRADVAEDVDSTAWVVLSATATGVRPAPGVFDRAATYLLAHRRAGGGFATYDGRERRRLTVRDVPQWSDPDVSVTCSALLALAALGRLDGDARREGCAFVAGRCTGRGWTSQWWKGTAYATWLAVLVLTSLGDGIHDKECAIARDHLLATRRVDGGWGDGPALNAFDTALAILTLSRLGHAGDAALLAASTSALAGCQAATGGWPGGARMLAPGAHPGLVLRDRLVTTALAIAALNRVRGTGTV